MVPLRKNRTYTQSNRETRTNDMTDSLIAPHGGQLITNMAGETERLALQESAKDLAQITIDSRQLADLEMLAIGAYSPLTGFMTRTDYLSVVNDMHLSNGLPWTVPITLATTAEQAVTLKEGSEVALVDAIGTLQAIMKLQEKYGYDKQLEVSRSTAHWMMPTRV